MVRLSLNRYQRAVLFVIAAAIIVVQLVQFADDGLQGHGWIWSFVVAGGLAVLSLFPATQPTPGKPTFAIPSKEELEKKHAALRENAEVLSIEVEHRAKALSDALVRDKDEMSRSKLLGDQMVKQFNLHIYERCLFLMLGLVGMRRSGGKELYVTGIEFKALQENVSKKVIATSVASQKVGPVPVASNPEALSRSILADLLEVRKMITAYCVAVKSQNPDPEAELLKWFESSGFKLDKNPHVAQALRSDA